VVSVVGVLRGSFLLYKFESGIFLKKIYICYMSVYTQEKFNADSPNTVVPVLGGGVLQFGAKWEVCCELFERQRRFWARRLWVFPPEKKIPCRWSGIRCIYSLRCILGRGSHNWIYFNCYLHSRILHPKVEVTLKFRGAL
jgi:hypothetical protein